MRSLRCRDCRGFTCSTWNIAESADVLTTLVPGEAICLEQPGEQGSKFAVGRFSLSCLNLAALHVEVAELRHCSTWNITSFHLSERVE